LLPVPLSRLPKHLKNESIQTLNTTPLIAAILIALSATPVFARSRHNLGGVEAEGRYAVVFPTSAARPNPTLTPGAVNPAVTQDNLDETICRKGDYTKSIRPPEEYTARLKREQIREYGFTDYRMRDYEEDHLISLELGGSPLTPPGTCGRSRIMSLAAGGAMPRTSWRTACTAWYVIGG
jgi:hypothetical protein